jgi:hypothetical protein
MHGRAEDLLKLRELPELAPPPGVWERALEAAAARTAARRVRRRAVLAAAAVVAAAIPLTYMATLGAPARPTLIVAAPRAAAVPPEWPSYAPLVAESARLERLLAELPAPRPLRVGPLSGTVAGLEDRIAVIDAQLSYAAARDLAPPYREALWGERVELMNALVYVRFAQTQDF